MAYKCRQQFSKKCRHDYYNLGYRLYIRQKCLESCFLQSQKVLTKGVLFKTCYYRKYFSIRRTFLENSGMFSIQSPSPEIFFRDFFPWSFLPVLAWKTTKKNMEHFPGSPKYDAKHWAIIKNCWQHKQYFLNECSHREDWWDRGLT